MDGPAPGAIFLFEGFRFDRSDGSLSRENGSAATEPLTLGSRAGSLLALLVERQGEVVTKNEIFAAVWPGSAVEEANLTVQVSALRRVLDQDRKRGSCIQTVPGRGYRFVSPVTRLAPNEVIDAGFPVGNSATGTTTENGEGGRSSVVEQAVQEVRNGLPPNRFRRVRIAAVAVALCFVTGGAAALNWHSLWLRHTQTVHPLSIVVLPFANLTNDPGQQHFVDAITAGLTTDLSRIWYLSVISRDSAFSNKDKPIDAKQIARELGVRYVVGGGVGLSGDRTQVNYQLADVESGAERWADRFEIGQYSAAEIQDEIVGRLARTLDLKLLQIESRRIEREKPSDISARDLVIRGWAGINRENANPIEIQQLFERALTIEPQSANARLGLARLLLRKLTYPPSRISEEYQARAEQLLSEALTLGRPQAETHATMGFLRFIQDRLTEAQVEFETAIALNRNHSLAHYRLGLTLMYLGQPEAGIPHIEKAMRLNPAYPNIARYYWGLGACHFLLGHLDQSIDLLRKAHAINPQLYSADIWLAGALGLKGDLEGARTVLAELSKINPELISSKDVLSNYPYYRNNPEFLTLRQNSLGLGLRRAGVLDD
jgi:TolB-like protein/DNA-binding winged helix-turn-helix (wHTH) protein/Tfp pilus assembly protein PilF